MTTIGLEYIIRQVNYTEKNIKLWNTCSSLIMQLTYKARDYWRSRYGVSYVQNYKVLFFITSVHNEDHLAETLWC